MKNYFVTAFIMVSFFASSVAQNANQSPQSGNTEFNPGSVEVMVVGS